MWRRRSCNRDILYCRGGRGARLDMPGGGIVRFLLLLATNDWRSSHWSERNCWIRWRRGTRSNPAFREELVLGYCCRCSASLPIPSPPIVIIHCVYRHCFSICNVRGVAVVTLTGGRGVASATRTTTPPTRIDRGRNRNGSSCQCKEALFFWVRCLFCWLAFYN